MKRKITDTIIQLNEKRQVVSSIIDDILQRVLEIVDKNYIDSMVSLDLFDNYFNQSKYNSQISQSSQNNQNTFPDSRNRSTKDYWIRNEPKKYSLRNNQVVLHKSHNTFSRKDKNSSGNIKQSTEYRVKQSAEPKVRLRSDSNQTIDLEAIRNQFLECPKIVVLRREYLKKKRLARQSLQSTVMANPYQIDKFLRIKKRKNKKKVRACNKGEEKTTQNYKGEEIIVSKGMNKVKKHKTIK